MLTQGSSDTDNEHSINRKYNTHGLCFEPIQQEDWLTILEEKSFDEYRRKDLVLALFYSPFLNNNQLAELMSIFSSKKQYVLPNPQEPNAYYTDLIDRDVGRTYQQISYFKDKKNQNQIRQLLLNYADFDQVVGYAQGMNFIAGTLVYLQVPQQQQLFNEIINRHRDNYMPGTPGLFQNLAELKFKLRTQLPKVYQHLRDVGITDLGICFSQYYLTLMMHSTPFQYQLLLLNIYMLSGERYITKLLIAMLKLAKCHILKLKDFEQIHKFIRNDLTIYFFQQIEICRKEQRLIQLLYNIGLVKKVE